MTPVSERIKAAYAAWRCSDQGRFHVVSCSLVGRKQLGRDSKFQCKHTVWICSWERDCHLRKGNVQFLLGILLCASHMTAHPILYWLNFIFFFSLTFSLTSAMDSFCDILFATENALTGNKAKIFFSPVLSFPIYLYLWQHSDFICYFFYFACSPGYWWTVAFKNTLLGQPSKDSTEIHLHSLGTEIFLQ